MTTSLRSLLLLAAVSAIGHAARADRPSAETLQQRLDGTVHGMEIHPVWAPDDSALYYHKDNQILRVDTATGKATPAIDFQALAKAAGGAAPRIERFTIDDNGDFTCLVLSGNQYSTLRIDKSSIEQVAPENDPFALKPLSSDLPLRSDSSGGDTSIIFINNTDKPVQIFWADSAGIPQPYSTIDPGAYHVQHTYATDAWIAGPVAFIADNDQAIAYLGSTPQAPAEDHQQKLASKWAIHFQNHNIFVKERATQRETQLTDDGTADWKYGGPAIESPDGRYLMAVREKAGDDRHIDLIEAAPEGQLQPRTLSIPYLKPGDQTPIRIPCLFDLQTMKPIPLDDTLFSNPWDVSDFHWSPDSSRLFFLYNERGHQVARLLAVQAGTGKVASVAEEKSTTFIDWTNKLRVHHLDQTDEAIWMSERSGWNHLYLVDRKTGEINPITQGEWVVRSIEQIDEDKREILFRACGV